MQSTRQVVLSVLFGALSIVIAIGGVSLSMAENSQIAFSTLTETSTNTEVLLIATETPTFANVNSSVTIIPPTETITLTSTNTFAAPTNCPIPNGWIITHVLYGDTPQTISTRYNISVQYFKQQNCLQLDNLIPNSVIYVPYIAPITPTPCLPPAGWIQYIVQPGDTLYHLAWAYTATVTDLQRGNCMGASYFLSAYQILYVPNVVTRTPSPTVTPFPSDTPLPTETPEPEATSADTTPTLEPTATATQ